MIRFGRTRRARVRTTLSAALALTATVLVVPATAGAADIHATPSTFASAVSSAQAGDTVLLASGGYGTWSGTSKAITVRADSGASVSMRFDFDSGDGNFTVDGVSGGDNDIANGAHDITIRNGTFSGTMKVQGLNEANVVLDHDTFTNDYGGCLPRIWLPYTAQHDSGLVVQNSRFTAGSHDGIQTGTAMSILNNEFVGIEHGSNQDCHTDNIQLYEGRAADGNGTTIRGNYIHDGESAITQYDGGGQNVIEDNVVARMSLFGFVFGGDKGSRIVHNVGVDIEKQGLDLTSKAGMSSSGQTIKDNVFKSVALGEGPPATYSNNMLPSDASGTNFNGTPGFAGGAKPSSYAGFALASGSPGKARASDGLDVGARFGSTPPPPPDTTPPDTTISSGPADPSSSAGASFSFASTESGSTFECKLDSGTFAACSAPKSYSGLSNGSHTFSVRATDAAGNTDATPASWTWTIDASSDTTPPDTTIASGPSNPTTSTSASFAFTSSESASTFECKLDAGAYVACTGPKAYSGLSAGSHTFSVRATDPAGNTDASPATQTWTINPPADTTPPNTTITTGPSNPTTSTSASFAFTSSESGSTFACKLDFAAYAACTSPKSYSVLGTGSHTFSVRATDAAGNTDGSPATRSWTINPPADTTAPETTITTGPSGATNDSTPAFGFSSSEAGSTFACRVDGGAYAACTSPWATPALSDASHTVSVRATDAAGNTDATPATRSFRVDTVAPTTTITSSPPALSLSGSGSVAFTVSESGATSQCRLDGGAWTACTSPYQVSGLGIGGHTVDVRSTDAVGNAEDPGDSVSWTVVLPVTSGPTVTLMSPTANSTVGRTARFSASAASPSGVSRVEFWVDGKRVARDSRAPYADRVDLSHVSNGMHTVTARAFDRSGQAASSAALVRVARSSGRARARAAVSGASRGALVSTAAAGPDATRLAGQAPKQRMLRVSLTRCADSKGAVADSARLRADGQGHVDGTRSKAGLCVLRLTLMS
jgi:Big-like domain-containing protein/parallel beta helix pectate lyase-like protein